MGEQRLRIEPAGRHRSDGFANTLHINLLLALMGVDYVEAAPIPELHVDLPRTVLVISRDDKSPPLPRQFRGEIEWPLLADGLYHAVTEGAGGEIAHPLDDGVMILERNDLLRAHAARKIESERTPRYRDHPRARIGRKLCKYCAQKSDADDGDRLPGFDAAAPEDVHRATQRLSGKGPIAELLRQRHHGVRRSEVVFGIGLERERRDTCALLQLYPGANSIDDAPCLMAERTGLGGKRHPLGARPWNKVGRTDAASFQPHPDLPVAGVRNHDIADIHLAGADENSCFHDVYLSRVTFLRRGFPSQEPPMRLNVPKELQQQRSAMNIHPTDKKSLRSRIEDLGPWFHNMELNGVWTAPDHFLGNYPAVKWQRFCNAIPTDLTGRSVLDIGCNAGFYSIQMKQRGAARVLGIDYDDRYLAQARLAADVQGLSVEFRKLSVYDVAALGERFDIVLFMGVLYHLRHPLLALDLIHEHVARDLLIFQSMQRGSERMAEVSEDYAFEETDHFDDPGYPKLHFIEHRYAGDPTNWWAPNAACAEAMLRSSGFEILSHPEQEVYVCRRCEDAPASAAVYPARETAA